MGGITHVQVIWDGVTKNIEKVSKYHSSIVSVSVPVSNYCPKTLP